MTAPETELLAWARSEANQMMSKDLALILWSLAAVHSERPDRDLVHALAARANAVAASFTTPQIAMTWQALSDLGATPPPVSVSRLTKQVRAIAATFTALHAKQIVPSHAEVRRTRQCCYHGAGTPTRNLTKSVLPKERFPIAGISVYLQ